MPVVIKKNKIQFKDTVAEQYVGVDVIAEQTTAEHVAEINAAGDAMVAAGEQMIATGEEIFDAISRLDPGTKIDEPEEEGEAGQVLTTDGEGGRFWATVQGGGSGGGGTSDYRALTNKPKINGITLSGNKSLNDLGIAAASDIPDVSGFYTVPTGGIPATDIASGVIPILTDLIDDTAGNGDTDVVWSANKINDTLINSPAFNGIPTAPTAAKSTNTTQIATTAYVKSVVGDYALKESPALTGIPTAPTATKTTNNIQIATTAYVKNVVGDYATKASPALTGTPTAPTPGNTTNNTQIATTAFVKNVVGNYATKASPALIGTPTAPTATAGTNTTQIATTAYVQNAISGLTAAQINKLKDLIDCVTVNSNKSIDILFGDTSANAGYRRKLTLQNDGNVVLYTGASYQTVLWQTSTGGVKPQ